MAFVDFLEPSGPLPTNPDHAPYVNSPSTGLGEREGGKGGGFNFRLKLKPSGSGALTPAGSGALTPSDDVEKFDLRRPFGKGPAARLSISGIGRPPQSPQSPGTPDMTPASLPNSDSTSSTGSSSKGRRMSFAGARNLLSLGMKKGGGGGGGGSGCSSPRNVFGGGCVLDSPKSEHSSAPGSPSPQSSAAQSPKSVFAESPSATPRPRPVFPDSPSQRPMMGVDSPARDSPQRKPLVNEVQLKMQSTMERQLNGSLRTGRSIMDTTGSSGGSGTLTSRDLLSASAPEDMANDAALGAFLAATNAAARQRKQRAAVDEFVPRSQQLLSQQVTRRSRRMSSDAAVCETRPWVDALMSSDVIAKREAAKNIRTALKDGPENRTRLVGSGGVRPLVLALKSSDIDTADHAAAALLFLSMSRDTAKEVVNSAGIQALIEAVANEDSLRESSRSHASACLFALSQKEDTRRLIHSQGAIPPLVSLLLSAKTVRAKKDVCLALFNMALVPQGAEEIVELGGVGRTVELLEQAEEGVEEKAAALLGPLSKCDAGLKAIEQEDGALYALADTLEGGSPSAAEHACVTLRHLASKYPMYIPKMLAEGCLPPLVKLATEAKKGSESRLLLEILRAYCKKKAKEQEMEHKRKEPPTRPPSRLANHTSNFDGNGRPNMVDKATLLQQWSGESAPAVM